MQVNFDSGYTRPQFQRRLTPTEMKSYTRTVKDGLRVLDKELGFIVHNSSVPSIKGQNTGIGSLLSKAAQFSFIPFLLGHGMSTIQQDPNNQRSMIDPSPYSPVSQSKNIYMIPLDRLASEEYEYLLSEETISNLDAKTRATHTDQMKYLSVTKDYDAALREAYGNYKNQLNSKPSAFIKNLNQEFESFKGNKYEELEPHAIYEIISKEYSEDDWKKWNEVDKDLYSRPNEKTAERLNSIKANNVDEIDFYMFKQFIVEREIVASNKRNKEAGIKVIGDAPVAYSNVVVWQNRDLFFDNLSLGCHGQRWDFPILRPETIFNPDGSLGEGGKLMQKRYEKMFEASPGGIRIDHIIGLIDPYVYVTDAQWLDGGNSGLLYSSDAGHHLFGKYKKYSDDDYAAVMEKIVIPAAEKYGIAKENIICEDLGHVTHPVRNIMNRFNLPGLTVTEFNQRGRDANPNNVIMLGSHDNQPFLSFADGVFSNPDTSSRDRKAQRLAEDTIVPGEDFGWYKWQIFSDKIKYVNTAFTELFTSRAKKIQVFFTDFLGINQRYNTPGMQKGCWELRVPENYEDVYYENLKKGTAMNIPDGIARAIRNKGTETIERNRELLERLDNFTQILKS